jgi:hypothetical protein
MKKIVLVALAALIAFPAALRADEGMWLPMLIKRLNERDMQKLGLQLTAEELYSVNNSSLKDAVVNFGGFCTGEIVSDQGLILTNHHCGYDAIRSNSTVENDILTNGFWALAKDQELPIPGLTATFLIRMDDVTEQVLSAVGDTMSEAERGAAVRGKIKELIDAASEDNEYKIEIKDFFAGNEYYQFTYEVFTDIRLVGAPPSSVGKYGGDTDNWMWPRHTGDFSMFRVYAGADNKPAEYAEDNVPYVPKHHLPVSIDGVENGDFAMIFGYPGSTDRYLTSYGIQEALDVKNQAIVDIRAKKLDIMKKYMDADDATRIQYASTYAQTANYWKYYIGQTEQLKKNKVYDQKVAIEDGFTNWVGEDASRQDMYGDALGMIEASYGEFTKTTLSNVYLNEAIFQGPASFYFAYQLRGLQAAVTSEDTEKIAQLQAAMGPMGAAHFEEINNDIDQETFGAMMKMYVDNVPADQQSAVVTDMVAKYKNDFDRMAAEVYATSVFTDAERFASFLEKPKAKTFSKDPVFMLMDGILNDYIGTISPVRRGASAQKAEGARKFIAGLREMNPNKSYYPDANFTMRMTYGTVGDYNARDAVHYSYYTTLRGVMEKEDDSDDEFVVPQKLNDLYDAKDYGQYANEDGELVVCFITNNDITGGNSGSPVINGKGELIGCAFDGNWEAMSGDIAFEDRIQRTIAVDARYILFIIEKYGGATNIIEEMTIVKTEPKEEMPAQEEAPEAAEKEEASAE